MSDHSTLYLLATLWAVSILTCVLWCISFCLCCCPAGVRRALSVCTAILVVLSTLATALLTHRLRTLFVGTETVVMGLVHVAGFA